MKALILSAFLCLFLLPFQSLAQEGNAETCYINRCVDSELTLLQLGNSDEIEVRSKSDGSLYGIISFTVEFNLGGSKIECTCRENKFTARCMTLKGKLSIDDTMVIKDVVYKDIKGGGKIRTAPELTLTIIKPIIEDK